MINLKTKLNRLLYGEPGSEMNFTNSPKVRSNLTMTEITKDDLIGDILDAHPEVAPHLIAMGMHCLGCPSSRGESLEQACMVHGVEVEDLLAQMNAEI